MCRIRERKLKARRDRKVQGFGTNLLQSSSEKDLSQQQWQMGPVRKQKSYDVLWLAQSSTTILNHRK